MKKLVFVSLLGSLVAPTSALAQDAESAPLPEEIESEGHAVEETTSGDDTEDEGSWTDHLTYNIFADTFYQKDWNNPQNPTAMTSVPHRGYEYTDGFGLAFAGVDAAYTGQHFGATVSLRYGVGAQRYLIGGNTTYNPTDPTDVTGTGGGLPATGGFTPALAAVKQAFGSIMPTEGLTIDVGLFDTIYGAEVADSWVNFNYTRSPLNYLLQPFYHLGVRATYQINDNFLVRGLVANPTNAYTSFTGTPYVGAQVGFLSEHATIYAGVMSGATGYGRSIRTHGTWEQFYDVVATLTFGDFTFVGNFDLWHNPVKGADNAVTTWGMSGVAHYQITDNFGVAGRFDYIRNPDAYFGAPYNVLEVGTATLDYRPFGDHVILRLEQRFEHADTRVFVDSNTTMDPVNGLTGARNTWMSTTLSAVIRTGN